jgi:ATP synthase protein I
MSAADNNKENRFSQQVTEKENRKLKAQQEKKQSPWLGFGMFGMVGWSVAVPVLLGTALGIWLDKAYPQSFSWTLTCLISGLIVGCVIAWNWINKER